MRSAFQPRLFGVDPAWLIPAVGGASILAFVWLAHTLGAVFALVGLAAIGMFMVLLIWPEVAALSGYFLLYTNLAVVLGSTGSNMDTAFTVLPLLLFTVTLCHNHVLRGEPIKVDRVFLLMIVFLAVQLLSAIFAEDKSIAAKEIMIFATEGLGIYLVTLNIVRRPDTLKKVLWTVLVGGALLGALSAYQSLTGNYEQEFGGLAKRQMDPTLGTAPSADASPTARVHLADRALGSVGDPNRYGQMLLVLLPWAVFLFYIARTRKARLVLLCLTVLVLAGIVFSYSRGAFVTLLVMVLLLAALRIVRLRYSVGLLIPVIVVVIFLAPGYLARIRTLGGVGDLAATQPSSTTDMVIRGRATEMLAAVHVFLDHPLLGVGPGQYAPFYSMKYQTMPEVNFRLLNRPRRAHSLYFEMAAELGIIGLTLFLAMPILLIRQFWKIRKGWVNDAPDVAAVATAMMFSLIAYLGTGVFLHLAYARYYWFLLAICGATLSLISRFLSEQQTGTRPVVAAYRAQQAG